ncbi:MAG TPA: hypothetical protein VGJ04_08800 [Pirellulales bacterium]|jgi:hypothetical protein
MFHRSLARLTLACYGLIAVFGQGLHFWLEPDDQYGTAQNAAVVKSASGSSVDGVPCFESDSHHRGHDDHDCSICQHHSLGQILVASAPVDRAPVVGEFLSASEAESAHCPALFSPAQPRAPPIG